MPKETTRHLWLSVPIKWSVLLAGLFAAFAIHFRENWIRWFPAWRRADLGLYQRIVEGESYYTHGPLVPLISVFAALQILRLGKAPVSPRPMAGGIVFGVSLMLHLAASLARVNFASGFMLIGVLAGIILFVWGDVVLRRLWFPILMLVFMLPLPEVTIAQLNFRLKMLAAGWGVALANVSGIIAEQSGNMAFLEGGKSLTIANVCNGLRTLISLLAFGAIYAYVCTLRGWWRLGLFLAAAPVALAANSVRILALIAVAHFWTVDHALGVFHDTSGLMIYALAFIMMFTLEKLVIVLRSAIGRPAVPRQMLEGMRRTSADGRQALQLVCALTAGKLAVLLAPLLVAGALTSRFAQPGSGTPAGKLGMMLPTTCQIDGHSLHGYDMTLDSRTLTILESPDYLYRQYVAPGASPIDFCIIFSRDNRKGVHPPDLCLEGGGQEIVAKQSFLIDVPGVASVPFRELVVRNGATEFCYIYTYKSDKGYTTSFWRQQWTILVNSFLKRDSAGALIRLSTPISGSAMEARSRLISLFSEAAPHLDDALQ